MEGVIPSPSSRKSRVIDAISQHPGVVLLGVAVLLGLLALPALMSTLQEHDTLINGRLSLIDSIWLVIALALSIVCLIARASLRHDLGEGTRQLIASTTAGSLPAQRGKAGSVDTPALGAAIVRGVLDLAFLLIIQGIVRMPLVQVISAYEPKATVDGAFVVVVVLIALLMLFGLYRTSQPLTEYLVTVGLDRIVPTAGFAASDLPETSPTRTVTRTPVSRGAALTGSKPTVAVPGRAPEPGQPTIAAPPTMAASAESTIAAAEARDPSSAEATIAAPPSSTGSAETIVDVRSAEPGGSSEATVIEVASVGGTPAAATIVESKDPGMALPSDQGATIVEAASSSGSEAESTRVAPLDLDAPGERLPPPQGESLGPTTAPDEAAAGHGPSALEQQTVYEAGDTASDENKSPPAG
jgi:hypothetical protein